MSAPAIPTAPKTARVRAGLYQTQDAQGNVWTIEDRQDSYGGGKGWAWFATCENGDALDPSWTKGDAAAAIAAPVPA